MFGKANEITLCDVIFNISYDGNSSEARDTACDPGIFRDMSKVFDALDLQLTVWRVAIIYLERYAVPLIVTTGLAGNLISFVVFVSRYMQPVSSSVYLAALSVADIGFLLSILVFWTETFAAVNGLCQIFTFVTYVSSFLSVWYVVGFTVERYLAVHFPLRRHIFCSKRTAKMVVSGLAILSAVLYNFGIWTSGVHAIRQYRLCSPLAYFVSFLSVADSIDTVVTFLLPILVICVLNIRIAYTVVNFYRAREQMSMTGITFIVHRETPSSTSLRLRMSRPTRPMQKAVGLSPLSGAPVSTTAVSGPSSSSTSKGHHQLRVTKLLLIVSGVFLVLNLPRHITRVYSLAVTAHKNEVLLTCEKLFQMIYYLHFSVNIFLYATVGGNSFRKAFTRIMRRMRRQAARPFTLLASLCPPPPFTPSSRVQRRLQVNIPLNAHHQHARNRTQSPRAADSYN